MKFCVERTSDPMGKRKPCDEAALGTYTFMDRRVIDDPRKIPMESGSDGAWWYEEGSNHRVENGEIVRDIGERSAWFVSLNTLEELMAFCEKYGNVIITAEGENPTGPQIEIYDDQRE